MRRYCFFLQSSTYDSSEPVCSAVSNTLQPHGNVACQSPLYMEFFFFFFLGVHGIFETGILEWIAISYSRGSFQPRNRTHVSCISCLTGRFFTTEPPGKPMCIYTYRYFRKLTDFMKNL